MTFTYAGTLATDLDWMRFQIQDVTANAGPKPDGANFTDAELTGLITSEGSKGRAVAACFEALAALWSVKYDFTTEGQSFRRSMPSDKFAKLASDWRAQYGSPASRASSQSVTRVDAYSDDLESDPS